MIHFPSSCPTELYSSHKVPQQYGYSSSPSSESVSGKQGPCVLPLLWQMSQKDSCSICVVFLTCRITCNFHGSHICWESLFLRATKLPEHTDLGAVGFHVPPRWLIVCWVAYAIVSLNFFLLRVFAQPVTKCTCYKVYLHGSKTCYNIYEGTL